MDELCETVVEFVEGALACGVIDLDSGRSTTLRHADSRFTELYLDAAVAAVDLFPSAVADELFMVAKGKLRFMKEIPGARAVAILVTRESTSHSLGWASLRAVVGALAAL